MTLVTRSQARAAGGGWVSAAAAEAQLRASKRSPLGARFDVFLSHSSEDAEVIVGVKALLEREGLTVYVDWIDDPQADRSRVTAQTAELLRARMKSCGFLLYASSRASSDSKWMPWELGYFDGRRPGRVGILPIVDHTGQSFKGSEYLGLYPVFEQISFVGLGDRVGKWTSTTDAIQLQKLARAV